MQRFLRASEECRGPRCALNPATHWIGQTLERSIEDRCLVAHERLPPGCSETRVSERARAVLRGPT
eukprot:8755298-Pyramimonas_sp.AAC.1